MYKIRVKVAHHMIVGMRIEARVRRNINPVVTGCARVTLKIEEAINVNEDQIN